MTAETRTNSDLHETWTIEDLTAFGAKLSRRRSRDEPVPGPPDQFGEIRIFQNRHQIGRYHSGQIVHVSTTPDRVTIGVRFAGSGSHDNVLYPDFNAREINRVPLGANFRPTAECQSPIQYDNTLVFHVLDISKQGARLSTSARNRSLLTGMTLENLRFNLPSASFVLASSEITYVSPGSSDDTIILGIRFLSRSDDFATHLVKYLIQFSSVDPASRISAIRTAGFNPKTIKSHVLYEYADTLEDYRQVLELRARAYKRSGKVAEDTPAAQMSDVFDLNSRIIVAKVGSRVVGSVRVTFCNTMTDRFELDDSITLPQKLPRLETAEVSRLCVDDDYENTDIVLGLIERCAEICMKTGMKYVFTSSVKSMVEYYKKIAFFPTGLTFELKTLNSIPHYFLLMDTRAVTRLRKYNPIYWAYTYGRMVQFMRRVGFHKGPRVSPLKSGIGKLGLWVMKKIRHLRTRSIR
jgi:c-di-GMP-binding flagellar brake protein YcgR